MTVIVAAKVKGDGVVIACDSQTTWGWQKLHETRSKIWGTEQYAVGAAGCVRTAQVIKHHTSWPKFRPDEDTDLDRFCVTQLVPSIRTGVDGAGVVKTVHGLESIESTLIVAWGDNIATIAGNGSVGTPTSGRAAIGSGYAEALGYLGDSGGYTRAAVIEAARRATITASGCDGPIQYITTRTLTVEEA